jgi:ubiquinone/menaquinone biosynthesis C-methylase UbiE
MLKKIINFFTKKEKLLEKESEELNFQKGWANEFKDNKEKVLEYWKKFRYLDDIVSICKINNEKVILDVGCGISTVLHYLEGKKFGIDPLMEEYKKLYEYPQDISVRKSYGEKIPFKSDTFDVVFCTNVIDHVANTDAVIGEIYRVLRRGGFLVLTVEVFENKVERNAAHPHCITRNDVDNLVPNDKFEKIFNKESDWISLRGYVNGATNGKNKEAITIWKKK